MTTTQHFAELLGGTGRDLPQGTCSTATKSGSTARCLADRAHAHAATANTF
ncbi:MAG TPA: hypothetical protein PLB10_15195 [Thiolinea sp.]|nr:hypothetical protein [Thiolinea sp.]